MSNYYKRQKKRGERYVRPKHKWRDETGDSYAPLGDGETAEQRGKQAESHVAELLEQFVTEGLIESYRHTKKFSADDRDGIDFWVFFDGYRMPLQVKSSIKALKADIREKLIFEPDSVVQFVVGNATHTESILRKRILNFHHYAK